MVALLVREAARMGGSGRGPAPATSWPSIASGSWFSFAWARPGVPAMRVARGVAADRWSATHRWWSQAGARERNRIGVWLVRKNECNAMRLVKYLVGDIGKNPPQVCARS